MEEGLPSISRIDLGEVLERYKVVEQRDYQNACIKDLVEAVNDGNDILIDLPTGSGKTFVYAPIATQVSETGGRVLILTATKQAQRRVSLDINRFKGKSPPSLIYGIQEYDCPVLKGKAENWCCSELKEAACEPNNVNCEVIRAQDSYKESSLVVTNFSKFLLASIASTFDIIVLDDSHSFENIKEQAYQITLQAASCRRLYESGIDNAQLRDTVEAFLNIFVDIFSRCVDPNKKEGIIDQDYILQLAGLITEENDTQLEQSIRSLPEPDRTICWNIYFFIKRCKSSSKHQFYVRQDFYEADDWDSSELISRRDDSLEFVLRKRFGDSRVIFVTATPGDISKHVSSCTLRDYDKIDIRITPSREVSYQIIDDWFKKLRIIVVQDIYDTRRPEAFREAIKLTTEILGVREERALILFKNYRDQRQANDSLSEVFSQDKLFFIDSSVQDKDFVEELASKTRISLASASSTLWEGINIKGLRITVVISPPFIRPHVGQRQNYPQYERRMLVRLQQGIGRLIRGPRDYGVAVLTDARFNDYVRRRYFNQRLRDQTEFLDCEGVIPRINELLENNK